MYKEPQNNPMIPNDQRKIYQQNKPPPKQTEPLLNLQLFQPQPPPKPKQPIQPYPNPSVFYPNYMPNPFNPAEYLNYMRYQYGPAVPLVKEYNINIGGISGSHVSTAMLFEDVLPVKNIQASFITVGERLVMYDYIRSVMFTNGDGDDMPLDAGISGGGDAKNLLSKIKFMDINPYNVNKFSDNPYKGMPFGFFLFRSCYPIRHDMRSASAICAQNSTGINVRIYRLTEDAYMASKHDGNLHDFDQWRDIAFYNYIKETVLKKKVSPNFHIMYGYSVTLNSGIKFDDLKRLQLPQNILERIMQKKPNPADPCVYKGKVIVCLTEAANYNLLKWATREYRAEGNVKHMINYGYHPKVVWEGVLFQLMSAFYCMQIKGIVINKFKVDRNVYIKDISSGGNVTNYWKYRINGIDYYIPNHGYVVLIDTNYRDYDDASWYEKETDASRERKIDGKFLSSSKLSDSDIVSKVFDMFKTTFDPNIFDTVFTGANGIKPPEDIMRLLENIHADAAQATNLDISFFIRKYMTMFLHNRVGDLLTEIEKLNVKTGSIKEFRKGQMVVWSDTNGFDRFVIHVQTYPSEISRIITKENKNITEKEVPVTSLSDYSAIEAIKQNFKPDAANLNEDALLETYEQ